MKIKIYYHDTDCGGVVYYANYLKYLEQARTDFFAERGLVIKDLAKEGIMFVVARQEIDYKIPAVYADTLEVLTKVGAYSGVRIEFEHEIKNQNNQLVTKAKTTMVCVDSTLKPMVMPDYVNDKLTKE